MSKREFVLLAQNYDPKKHRCMGWYASEKLDGIRCIWDGGISRGLPASQVPWANVAKDGRYKSEIKATGLWTRYGKTIQAPSWFLDSLPNTLLDGEMYAGRKSWQRLSSIIKQLNPGPEWEDVTYRVFDSPPLDKIFSDGLINTGLFKKRFVGCDSWAMDRGANLGIRTTLDHCPFYKSLALLKQENLGPHAILHEQFQLPENVQACAAKILERTKAIEDAGGEGLIVRGPVSFWKPERSWDLLKVKTLHDAEGVVISYTWAKATDMDRSLTGTATNKLLGLMGSVRLKLDSGVEFDLSGFTDAERGMDFTDDRNLDTRPYGAERAGQVVGDECHNPTFPRGSKVTFKYRELSDEGFPKEARYLRKHEDL